MSETSFVEGGRRQGAFVEGDEEAVFGKLFLDFCAARNQAKNLALEGSIEKEDVAGYCLDEYEAAFWWAYAVVESDDAFMRWYKDYEGRDLQAKEMMQVLGMIRAALRRNEFWTYPRTPVFDVGKFTTAKRRGSRDSSGYFDSIPSEESEGDADPPESDHLFPPQGTPSGSVEGE